MLTSRQISVLNIALERLQSAEKHLQAALLCAQSSAASFPAEHVSLLAAAAFGEAQGALNIVSQEGALPGFKYTLAGLVRSEKCFKARIRSSSVMQPWGWNEAGDQVQIDDNTPCEARFTNGAWHVEFEKNDKTVSMAIEEQYLWTPILREE